MVRKTLSVSLQTSIRQTVLANAKSEKFEESKISLYILHRYDRIHMVCIVRMIHPSAWIWCGIEVLFILKLRKEVLLQSVLYFET